MASIVRVAEAAAACASAPALKVEKSALIHDIERELEDISKASSLSSLAALLEKVKAAASVFELSENETKAIDDELQNLKSEEVSRKCEVLAYDLLDAATATVGILQQQQKQKEAATPAALSAAIQRMKALSKELLPLAQSILKKEPEHYGVKTANEKLEEFQVTIKELEEKGFQFKDSLSDGPSVGTIGSKIVQTANLISGILNRQAYSVFLLKGVLSWMVQLKCEANLIESEQEKLRQRIIRKQEHEDRFAIDTTRIVQNILKKIERQQTVKQEDEGDGYVICDSPNPQEPPKSTSNSSCVIC